MSTQKQLIETLILEVHSMKNKLPNGELKLIQKSLDDLDKGQCDIKRDVHTIQKRLFNPDNGLIVEVHKNTEAQTEIDGNMEGWMKEIEHFHSIVIWKKGVQRGLWVLYSAIIGILIKILFWE